MFQFVGGYVKLKEKWINTSFLLMKDVNDDEDEDVPIQCSTCKQCTKGKIRLYELMQSMLNLESVRSGKQTKYKHDKFQKNKIQIAKIQI